MTLQSAGGIQQAEHQKHQYQNGGQTAKGLAQAAFALLLLLLGNLLLLLLGPLFS